jgi:hypothetical protein
MLKKCMFSTGRMIVTAENVVEKRLLKMVLSVLWLGHGLHGPWFELRQGQQIFIFTKRPDLFCGPPSLLPNEFFSGSKAARALTTHLHLLQMLGMTGVMPVLPYRISRRRQGTFTFTSAISFHHQSYMDWRPASKMKGLWIIAWPTARLVDECCIQRLQEYVVKFSYKIEILTQRSFDYVGRRFSAFIPRVSQNPQVSA